MSSWKSALAERVADTLAVAATIPALMLGCGGDDGGSDAGAAGGNDGGTGGNDGGSDAGGSGDNDGGGDAGSLPAAYAAVQALFSGADGGTNCGTFACHGGAVSPAEFRAWVEMFADGSRVDKLYEWAVGQDALPCADAGLPPMKRVDPGSPETSYLVHALRGTNLCGARMPSSGPYLDEKEIQLVERWIRGLRP
jgi:hypothetical protein